MGGPEPGSIPAARPAEAEAGIKALLASRRPALEALVDPQWYFATQAGPDALRGLGSQPSKLEAALHHYAREGAERGLNPGPLFDTRYYLKCANAAIDRSTNPLVHFLTAGVQQGHPHHPLVHIKAVLNRPGLGLDFTSALEEGRVEISPLFDEVHYLAGSDATLTGVIQLLKSGLRGSPAILDYLTSGWRKGRNPHPLFDTEFYMSQVPDAPAGIAPLQHYLSIGSAKGLMPHPLFDPAFYRERMALSASEEPLRHYLSQDKERTQPHPLFDVRRYLRESRRLRGKTDAPAKVQDPLLDYMASGTSNPVSPHALFDTRFYLSQFKSGDKPSAAPLIDYITRGWKAGRRPHVLFDSALYAAVTGPARLGSRDPLSHYVASEDRGNPHYLFLEAFYRRAAQLDDPRRTGLEHYIADGARRRLQPHPLFQPMWYAKQCTQAGLTEIDKCPDLLRHYLQEGCHVPLSPMPLFDAAHYAERSGQDPVASDLFEHFMTRGGFARFSPHPAIDLDHYCRQIPGYRRDADPVIWHLLDAPKDKRVSTHPVLDPPYYLAANKDLKEGGLCPILHFLEYGIHESRSPNAAFSRDYVRNMTPGVSFAKESAVYEYLRGRQRPVKIVFVSHEATRTGAPAIILRLLQEFSRLDTAECLTILDRGGERLDEFRQAGHVHVLSKSVRDAGEGSPLHDDEIASVLGYFCNGVPDIAIVNSVESRHIGFALDRLHIPVVWLVHEMAAFYKPDVFPRLYESSELVVMPSQFVRQSAARLVPEPPDLVVVKGQGLLTDDFGSIGRDEARTAVLRELDLPGDAFIVLGCGTLDQRKGLDYFAGAARSFLSRCPPDGRPAYFLWIGDGPRWVNSPYYFAHDEIERAGLQERIRFIGSRPDVEPYFVAADTLLMTSRADPFPCVIHEAMAARLPVVGFSGAGGAPELYERGGGTSVPLGDINAMADRVMQLYANDGMRQDIGETSRKEVLQNWAFESYFQFFVREIEHRLDVSLNQTAAEVPQSSDLLLIKGSWSPHRDSELLSILSQLRSESVSAAVVFPFGRFTLHGENPPKNEHDGLPLTYLQPAANTPAAIREQLLSHLRRTKPRLLAVESGDPAALYSRELRKYAPVIGFVDGEDEESISQGYMLGRYWDLIVARTAAAAEELLELNPGFAAKTVVIEKTIRAETRSAKYLSEKIAGLTGPPVFVCAGSIEQATARQRLEASLLGLAKAIPDVRLRLFLSGSEAARLTSILVHQLGSDRVKSVPGWGDRQVLASLKTATGFVFAADAAQSGSLVADAMGHGCIPIVPGAVAAPIAGLIASSKTGYCRGGESYEAFLNDLAATVRTPARLRSALEAAHAAIFAAGRARRRAALKLRRRIAGLGGLTAHDTPGAESEDVGA